MSQPGGGDLKRAARRKGSFLQTMRAVVPAPDKPAGIKS